MKPNLASAKPHFSPEALRLSVPDFFYYVSDLDGLWRSYRFVYRWIEAQGITAPEDLRRYRMRSRSIMVKSFLRAGRPLKAFKTLFDRIGRK